MVICKTAGCFVFKEAETEEQAIKGWNTRRPMENVINSIKSLSDYEIYKHTFDTIIKIVEEASGENVERS